MTEYITKEQAIDVVHEAIANIVNSDSEMVCLTDLEIEIQMTITDYTEPADVAEVVRCKDCKDFRPWGGQSKLGDCMVYVCDGENPFTMEETDFCSDGDRMDGESL